MHPSHILSLLLFKSARMDELDMQNALVDMKKYVQQFDLK
jgi:hypothetical protein